MSSGRESDFARLEQLLLKPMSERRRAEDERRNRKEADDRAEQERRPAEEAEAPAEIEEEKTKRTTLEEYLRACHTFLSKPLHAQTDKRNSEQANRPYQGIRRLSFHASYPHAHRSTHSSFSLSTDTSLISCGDSAAWTARRDDSLPTCTVVDLRG